MDPASIGLAITAASKAFTAIKNGFAIGRDIESMGKDLGRWMGALSDIDNAEKSAKNASPLRSTKARIKIIHKFSLWTPILE